MCGLIHCRKANNILVNKAIKKRFEKQRERGVNGFGFVGITNGIVGKPQRATSEKEAMALLEKCNANEILFHHRIPTSTPNFVESTHPISVINKKLKYNYYVIHNGIIDNDFELYEKHTKEGFKYTTKIVKQYVTNKRVYSETMFNDSESFAIELCKAIENDTPIQANGTIAFICLQYEKKTRKAVNLFYGRNNGNPLKIVNDKNILALTSVNGNKDVLSNTLNRYSYDDNKIYTSLLDIGQYNDYKSKYTYTYTPTTTLPTFQKIGYDTSDNDIESDSKQSDAIDLDEKDFVFDLEQDLQDLEKAKEKAKRDKDYDSLFEIECEIDTIKRDINTLQC